MTVASSHDASNAWVEALQRLINRLLGLDEEILHALQRLSGKIIFIDIINSDLHFYILFRPKGVSIKSDISGKPDVRVRGHPGSLLAALFAGKGDTAVHGDLEIIGDVNVIQTFQNIMFEFDPDWQEPVSRLLGDGITHQLARLLETVRKRSLDNRDHLMMEISEYLRFEKNIVPDASEIEEFNAAVAELRSATDIIEKRIEKLEKSNTTGAR